MFKNVQKNFGKSFEFLFSNFSKNGFGTIRDEQIDQYGPGIIESIDRTWAEVKPLYQKLHAVARFKIDQIFGKKLVKPDGNLVLSQSLSLVIACCTGGNDGRRGQDRIDLLTANVIYW